MRIDFTKMQGLGNDFVVIDATKTPFTLTSQQIQQIADRRYGVGCDQLLVIEPYDKPDADFRYRIFNADGGEVEQCGNGARCVALFIKQQKLSDRAQLRLMTTGGLLTLTHQDDDQVSVAMGVPRFGLSQAALVVEDRSFIIDTVNIGNPHVIIAINNISQEDVIRWGEKINQHTDFADGVNVNFMRIIDQYHIDLQVYERGAGATHACGSGACATLAVARHRGLVANSVTVSQPGGDLQISWQGEETEPVIMTGPGITVFHGTWING